MQFFSIFLITMVGVFGCKNNKRITTTDCTKFHIASYKIRKQGTNSSDDSKILIINRTINRQVEIDSITDQKVTYTVEWKDSCTYELSSIVSSTMDAKTEIYTEIARKDGPVCEIISTSENYFVISQKFRDGKRSFIDTCWLNK